LKLLQEGKFKKLPWLLSQTQDEGLYPAAEFYDDDMLKTIDERWRKLAPLLLDFNELSTNVNRKSQISLKIQQFYLGNEKISKNTFKEFDDILSDRLFKHGAYKSIQLQSRFSPSYFYYFRFKTLRGLNDLWGTTKDNIGVSHGEDVFLIYVDKHRHFKYSDEEATVSQNLINLYYNFARFDEAIYDNIKIEKSTPESVKYLEISKTAKNMEAEDDFGKVSFWDDIEEILLSKEKTSYDDVAGRDEL